MLEHDSDGEAVNSSYRSMSSESCSSFSHLSFDAAAATTTTFDLAAETLSLKPHRSSDFAYSAIRSKKTAFTYRDFHLHRRIDVGDIGTVYLCTLRSSDSYSSTDQDTESLSSSCLYAMKVIDKEALAMKKKMQIAEMKRRGRKDFRGKWIEWAGKAA